MNQYKVNGEAREGALGYIFGYGSLMNPKSVKSTGQFKLIDTNACLKGYRRVFNAFHNNIACLNIEKCDDCKIYGVLLEAETENDLKLLDIREEGYVRVDISDNILTNEGLESDTVVYTYKAPLSCQDSAFIMLSYIAVCLTAVKRGEWKDWVGSSVMNNKVKDDTENVPRRHNVYSEEFYDEVKEFFEENFSELLEK